MSTAVSQAKVLICDDSMMIRKKMRMLLENYGITNIYEAKDGKDAVEKYAEVSPDITFMDIVMPEMSGVEALKAIKSASPDANIVMATSIGTEGNLTEAIKYGASDFLQKPVEEERLVKLLDHYFKEV